ncbi:hypothetical protein B0H16DRAFT_1474261 [Mycena metata]|uniref:Uncharacterized protein n=1 Tax=Mycena metata TaxID=1033252 RepID=A0AAD7MJX1_9AGAR|nr:hypothetical protein B0H16DRAFT_1474261 [Mycena metata]
MIMLIGRNKYPFDSGPNHAPGYCKRIFLNHLSSKNRRGARSSLHGWKEIRQPLLTIHAYMMIFSTLRTGEARLGDGRSMPSRHYTNVKMLGKCSFNSGPSHSGSKYGFFVLFSKCLLHSAGRGRKLWKHPEKGRRKARWWTVHAGNKLRSHNELLVGALVRLGPEPSLKNDVVLFVQNRPKLPFNVFQHARDARVEGTILSWPYGSHACLNSDVLDFGKFDGRKDVGACILNVFQRKIPDSVVTTGDGKYRHLRKHLFDSRALLSAVSRQFISACQWIATGSLDCRFTNSNQPSDYTEVECNFVQEREEKGLALDGPHLQQFAWRVKH